MIPMDAFVSGSWQRKPDIRNVISGVFFSRCMEFRQRILNGLSGFRSCCHVINKMPERIRLDALAQQCGYYDEAHMIKDFKQYAGITPQGYERLITGTKIPELEL